MPRPSEVFAIGDAVLCRPLGSPPVVDDSVRQPGITEALHAMYEDEDAVEAEAWALGPSPDEDGTTMKDSTKSELMAT